MPISDLFRKATEIKEGLESKVRDAAWKFGETKMADKIEEGLDRLSDSVDRIDEAVSATLGDPKEEGMKRGIEQAANEFLPVLQEMESEYDDLIDKIKSDNESFEEKKKDLLSKIDELEAEKRQLDRELSSVAQQHNISVSMLQEFCSSPMDIFNTKGPLGIWVEKRVAELKKAKCEAYAKAKVEFEKKIGEMKVRLSNAKQQADINLRDQITWIEDALAELATLKADIAMSKALL